MRVTQITLEGTPDELRQLDEWRSIAANFSTQHTAPGVRDTEAEARGIERSPASTLPSELDNFIAKRAVNNPGRNLVRELAERFVSSGEATWRIGSSKNSADGQTPYFSLYAPGPQRVGAAAYIHPVNGRVNPRLRWDDPDIGDFREHTFKASEQDGNNFAVGVMVTSAETFDTAVQLIKLAIKRALEA